MRGSTQLPAPAQRRLPLRPRQARSPQRAGLSPPTAHYNLHNKLLHHTKPCVGQTKTAENASVKLALLHCCTSLLRLPVGRAILERHASASKSPRAAERLATNTRALARCGVLGSLAGDPPQQQPLSRSHASSRPLWPARPPPSLTDATTVAHAWGKHYSHVVRALSKVPPRTLPSRSPVVIIILCTYAHSRAALQAGGSDALPDNPPSPTPTPTPFHC